MLICQAGNKGQVPHLNNYCACFREANANVCSKCIYLFTKKVQLYIIARCLGFFFKQINTGLVDFVKMCTEKILLKLERYKTYFGHFYVLMIRVCLLKYFS